MSVRIFFVSALLLLSTASYAQEVQSLGDVARQARKAKAQQELDPATNSEATAQAKPGPVSAPQFFGWIAGGMAGTDIVAAVRARGIGFKLDQTFEDNLRLATGSADLLKQTQDLPQYPVPSQADAASVALLAQAASSIRQEDYKGAFTNISNALAIDPANP